MTATLRFTESNTAAQTVTLALTSGNYGSVDAPNIVPSEHTVVRPTAGGPNYSFEKWWRVQLASISAPTTKVDNFRFWKSAGGYATGETMKMNLELVTPTRQNDAYPGGGPVNTVSTPATTVIPAADFTEPAKNLFTGIGGSLDELNTALQFSDYIVVQAAIAVGATLGPVPAKTFRLHYDEQ